MKKKFERGEKNLKKEVSKSRIEKILSSVVVSILLYFTLNYFIELPIQNNFFFLIIVFFIQLYSLRYGRYSFFIYYKIVIEEEHIKFFKQHNIFNIKKEEAYAYKDLDTESLEKGSLFTLCFKPFNGFSHYNIFQIQNHKEKWNTEQLKEIEKNIKTIKVEKNYKIRL